MLLRAFLSHYRRHPLQLLALVLIIVLATGLWSGVWDLTRQARGSLEQGSQLISGFDEITRADGQPVNVTDFVRLRRVGVCVLPWLEVATAGNRGQVIGIDSLSLGCFAGESQSSGNLERFQGEPFVDIREASQLAEAESADARLRLMAPRGPRALPEGYDAIPAERRLDTGELADSFLLNLDALCVLVLLITGLLVRSVYLLGLSQRRAGFLLLRRFGVREARIRRYQVIELGVVSLLAAIPGTLLGLLLSRLFSEGFERALGGLFDVTLYSQSFTWMTLAPVLVMTALVLAWCLIAPGDADDPHRRLPIRIPAVGLLVVAAGWLVLAGSLAQVFVALALLFLSVGVLTPILLSGVLETRSRRTDRPLRRWTLRELAVMLRRLGLPVVALQFAAATVLAIQALVTTFETTFYDWLDQRLQGDIYVEWPVAETIDRVAPELDSLDTIETWYPVRRGDAHSAADAGRRIDLLALEPTSPLLRDWDFIESVAAPWDALDDGQVMVNEQLARRLELAMGDSLGFTIAGKKYERQVAAIYADYGRPSGEILISAQELPADFRPAFVSLTLDLRSSDAIRAVRETLRKVMPGVSLQIRDNASVRGLATRVFEQTFLLTRAISLLTLVLAGVALLVLGWVFFGTRRWYFHLLRVWGLSSRALRVRISSLSVGLTLLAALAALPLGVLLTWVLVARINPLAFGWSLPMAVYPVFWLQLLAVAVGIGLVIAWLIQRQLSDQAPEPVTVGHVEGAER
ncbi:ABC transporter permease [Marinobacter nanhaiticus D15-8W]|uniref:ABC transporter permease n=2 Tax=Marinobacter TaxID=2742 RepID=N6W8P8_9GAMM|nr:ABC transporter permease [Marinobacter nanhaiticus D15-8W]